MHPPLGHALGRVQDSWDSGTPCSREARRAPSLRTEGDAGPPLAGGPHCLAWRAVTTPASPSPVCLPAFIQYSCVECRPVPMLSGGGSSWDQASRGVCPPLSVQLGAVMSVDGTDTHKNCYPIQCHHELTRWTWLRDLTCPAPEEEGQALTCTALGRVCRPTGGGQPVQSGLAPAGLEGRHPPARPCTAGL